MDNSIKGFMKNFSYTLSSNFINLLVSAIVIFVVPKIINFEQYGYWQLFIFYSAYVPFLQFGWTDGIFLRYAGVEKKI